jgi:hypothetical protein
MSYSRSDQIEIIKSISIQAGERKTINCPFCGGPNKFTIDKIDGNRLIWNCYRASCPAKGSYSSKRSISAAKDYLANKVTERASKKLYPIPDIVTRPENHAPAMEYLKSVNSLEAYQSKLIKIRYAPAQGRVLFFNTTETGAVGRSLYKSKYKWWNFGNLINGIHVGTGNHAVCVEDAASACAVARLKECTGVALLGTNITNHIKKSLIIYKKVTLVLDNDASAKALKISSALANVNIRLTKVDLKELTTEKIWKVLEK